MFLLEDIVKRVKCFSSLHNRCRISCAISLSCVHFTPYTCGIWNHLSIAQSVLTSVLMRANTLILCVFMSNATIYNFHLRFPTIFHLPTMVISYAAFMLLCTQWYHFGLSVICSYFVCSVALNNTGTGPSLCHRFSYISNWSVWTIPYEYFIK